MVLTYPEKGQRLKDHLIAAAKSGRVDDRLLAVKIPKGVDYIWNIFWSVSGGDYLDYTKLEAYGRLTGWDPLPYEIDWLQGMAQASQSYIAEKLKEGANHA